MKIFLSLSFLSPSLSLSLLFLSLSILSLSFSLILLFLLSLSSFSPLSPFLSFSIPVSDTHTQHHGLNEMTQSTEVLGHYLVCVCVCVHLGGCVCVNLGGCM